MTLSLFEKPPDRGEAIELLHAATALYTTAQVVDVLLDRLNWPESGKRLLDPSAGDGSFLVQALDRLDLNDRKSISRLRGWEIHPGAIESARARIIERLCQSGWSKADARAGAAQILVNKDFLTDGPEPGEFDCIAGNPPYLRFQRLPEYFKSVYAERLPKYARGDLLHAFLDRCTESLAKDGAIGLVCSDRFLFNSSAADLRVKLGSRVSISHLARLDPATSFYRPKIRAKDTPPRIHPVEIVFRSVGVGLWPLTANAISPDDPGGLESTGRTLADVAKVSLAPWLGPAGIFVVSDSEAKSLREAGANLVPAVDTDDIDPATDQLKKPTRYAIQTYRDQHPVEAVLHHLRSHRERMPQRGRRNPYWMPPETITIDISKPSLLIPRIARRIRVVPLPAGVLPLNHNHSIVSTNGMEMNELRDLLLGERSERWIQSNAPRLESGYYSITTRLLRRMPL